MNTLLHHSAKRNSFTESQQGAGSKVGKKAGRNDLEASQTLFNFANFESPAFQLIWRRTHSSPRKELRGEGRETEKEKRWKRKYIRERHREAEQWLTPHKHVTVPPSPSFYLSISLGKRRKELYFIAKSNRACCAAESLRRRQLSSSKARRSNE